MMPAVMNNLYVDFYYDRNQTQFSLIKGERNFSRGAEIFVGEAKPFVGGTEPPLAPIWLRH